MQSRRIAHGVCLLAVIGATSAQVPNLFTFGDSLTDRGDGAFRLTDGTYPPPSAYWQGRFTNSPGTWADYVAARKLSTNTDFAIGASTACTYANATGHQLEFPSMVKQVDAWLADPKRPKGKKVVTIWAGHNDIMSGAELPKNQIAGIPKQVLACLLSAAGKVLAADKDATVLIGSLAPIDKTPLFGKIPQVAKLINTMNKILKTGVVGLKLKHGLNRVAYWDINKIMSDAIAKPSALGFTHGPPQSCVVFKSSFQNFFTNFTMVPSTPCATPNDYLFYDGVHPTSKSHSFIAASYFAKLVELKIIKSVPA